MAAHAHAAASHVIRHQQHSTAAMSVGCQQMPRRFSICLALRQQRDRGIKRSACAVTACIAAVNGTGEEGACGCIGGSNHARVIAFAAMRVTIIMAVMLMLMVLATQAATRIGKARRFVACMYVVMHLLAPMSMLMRMLMRMLMLVHLHLLLRVRVWIAAVELRAHRVDAKSAGTILALASAAAAATAHEGIP